MAEIVDFGLQKHKIKMDSRYFDNVLSVVAGDTGRRIEVQLLDTNGMVQDTTGLNLRLNAEIAGKATYTDATLVDATTGKYQLDLSNGMFLAPGNWQFQWQITDSAGKKLHSFAFTGNVGKNISEGGAEATNFYFNLKELQELVNDMSEVTPERTSFLEVGGYSTETLDLYKTSTLSPQGDFYMVENGRMANTEATQPYKNTGKVAISKVATYETRGVNSWLFYGENDVYLGYWEYKSSGAIDAAGLQDLPLKDGALYMIGNVNNLYWKADPVVVPQILESKETVDAVRFPQLVIYEENLNDGVKDLINNSSNGLAKEYKNKIIVNFGDSIIENKNPSVSDLLAEYTGATTVNVGFGGCMMSPHPNADFAKFSMSNLVDAVVSGDFSQQEAALTAPGIPASFRTQLNTLKAIDWAKVKTITISYGTNDWLNSNKIDNSANKYDKSYYLGALRYSVRKMMQTYKQLQVVVSPPIFRSTNDRTENANNWKNGNGEYLKDYANAVNRAGKELNILVADTFYGLGINEFNESEYFPANDGTHPNAKGRALLASKLAETIDRISIVFQIFAISIFPVIRILCTVIRAGKELNILVADTFYGLGINEFNESEYFPANDGTHPNAKGRALLASKLAETIVYGASANPNISEVEKKVAAVDTKTTDTLANYDSRITDIEEDIVVEATNLIENGDLSKGLTSNFKSSNVNAEVTVDLGKIKLTDTIVNRSNALYVSLKSTLIIGHKYYLKWIFKPYRDHYPKVYINKTVTTLSKLAKKNIDNVVSYTFNATIAGPSILLYSNGEDLQDMIVGSTSYFNDFISIDLTATFGAGNEPTATQMDRLLEQFPNSWFDGTQNIFLARWALNELRRLDDEKANRKQEEWITPTLINGATGTLQYRKNTLGKVEFRGRVNVVTSASGFLVLPINYRPDRDIYIPVSTTTGGRSNVFIMYSGYVFTTPPNELDCDSVGFYI